MQNASRAFVCIFNSKLGLSTELMTLLSIFKGTVDIKLKHFKKTQNTDLPFGFLTRNSTGAHS